MCALNTGMTDEYTCDNLSFSMIQLRDIPLYVGYVDPMDTSGYEILKRNEYLKTYKKVVLKDV